MNDLVIVNNQISFGNSGIPIAEEDIIFVERCSYIAYKDFDFKKWSNKYVKIEVEGSFPLRIGEMLSYKKSRSVLKGFILGYDEMSRVMSFLSKRGSEMIYMPLDGRINLFEGMIKNKNIKNIGGTNEDNNSVAIR
mgnify:CR=1 FL=1